MRKLCKMNKLIVRLFHNKKSLSKERGKKYLPQENMLGVFDENKRKCTKYAT